MNVSQMDEVTSHILINTLLQRGVGVWRIGQNRFSGFPQFVETVETVLRHPRVQSTPLKPLVSTQVSKCPIFSSFSPSPPDEGRRRGTGREGAFFKRFPSPLPSPHSFVVGRGNLCRYQWLKQGVNEKNPMKTGNFVNYSDTRKVVHA